MCFLSFFCLSSLLFVVSSSFQLLYRYYRRAADNPDRPHPKAACRTAAMLYSGTYKGSDVSTSFANETIRDKTQRLASALEYYKKASRLGDGEAENALGIMIEELGDVTYGENGERDDDARDSEMNGRSGSLNGPPRFLGRDPVSAGLWYRRAAFNGNPYALLNLARLYTEGKGVEKNDSYAAKLLRQAASAGVIQAEIELKQLERSMVRGSEEPLVNFQSPPRYVTTPGTVEEAAQLSPQFIASSSTPPRTRSSREERGESARERKETDAAASESNGGVNNEGVKIPSSPFTQAAENRLQKLQALLNQGS